MEYPASFPLRERVEPIILVLMILATYLIISHGVQQKWTKPEILLAKIRTAVEIMEFVTQTKIRLNVLYHQDVSFEKEKQFHSLQF